MHRNGALDTGMTVEVAAANGRGADECRDFIRPGRSGEDFIVPARRHGRRRPQPASASLFEWALSVDAEREAELAGVTACPPNSGPA